MSDTWRANGSTETMKVPRCGDPDARRLASQALQRWISGESADTLALLQQHPEIRQDKSAVLDLALEEFCQRNARGEALDAGAFARRFPTYQASLMRLLEVQRFLDQQSETTTWPEPGDEFLGFPLLAELGRGAFALVFLATEPKLGNRLVALKVSPLGMLEAERLGKLRHPNIVPVYRVDYDPKTDLTAVCMPYYGRATLCDLLDLAFSNAQLPEQAQVILQAAQQGYSTEGVPIDDPPDPWLLHGTYIDGVVRMGQQLAAALEYTHRRGIYHLDLKPSNVLLTPNGRPMLLDFNLALEERETTAGRMGGTLPYMSPEQIRACVLDDPSVHLDHRSDIFSLGVILYELLSNAAPFGKLEQQPTPRLMGEHLLQQQQRGPRCLLQRNARLNPALAELIERTLAFDPAHRPQTAGELAAALGAQLRPQRRLQRWVTRNRRAVCAGVLLSAIAAGALAGYAWSLDPYWVRMYRAGQASFERGEHRQALEYLNASLEVQPGDGKLLALRGQVHQALGNYQRAAYDYSQASQRIFDPSLQAREGYCRCLMEEYERASLAFEAARHAGFDNARVWSNLGVCHYRRNQFDEAERAFTEALRRDPELGIAYLGLAAVERQRLVTGRSSQVRNGLAGIEQALQRNPPSADLEGMAAMIYAAAAAVDHNYIDLCARHLERALKLGFDPRTHILSFEPVLNNPRIAELCQTPTSEPATTAEWFLDPVLQ